MSLIDQQSTTGILTPVKENMLLFRLKRTIP